MQPSFGFRRGGNTPARSSGLRFLTAQSVQQAGAIFKIRRAKRQAAKRLIQQIPRGQCEAFHSPSRIEDHERSQQIIHITKRGAKHHWLIRRYFARAFNLCNAG
jgi:hypothetical protein